MMQFKFVYEGRYPSTNEMLEWQNSQNGRWNRWAIEKKRLQAETIQSIEAAGKPERMFVEPVRVHFKFYEKDYRRDTDNISGCAHKVILDALQEAEVIKRDSPRYVRGHSDEFHVDPARPRVEVTVYSDTEAAEKFWHDVFRRIEEIPARDTDWE